MPAEKKQLGQMLIESGKLDKNQLEDALIYQRDHNMFLGKAVVSMGLLTETELIEILASQLGLPSLNLMTYNIEDAAIQAVDEKFCREFTIIPLFLLDDSITVATADPLNIEVIDELSRMKNVVEVNLVLATEMDIERAIDLYYRSTTGLDATADGDVRVVSKAIESDAEIVQVVNMLLIEAVNMGASDIHIEPRYADARIRYRVDGVLQQYYTVPKESLSSLISRIKILADMDIAENRRPQDGRFRFEERSVKVDLRTSTFPTPNGEKVVMRILDEARGKIELHKLGFGDDTLKLWRKIIKVANGIVLVTGPTGSGKTTTLYATLHTLNSVEVNIMTIEDPIEYQLENINQSQVNVKAGLTFDSALRTMMRQDPDTILVGEMRDVDTIALAVRAALTGHLVFSTLHTNDAASTYTRLLDMGVDSYLVASTVRAILTQRLMRMLCPRCKKPAEVTSADMKTLNVEELPKGVQIFKPVGCVHCRNSGYIGRVGAFELLVPTEGVTDLVKENASSDDIEAAAVKDGMRTLRDAARLQVFAGVTSMDEMLRVTL